MAKETEYQFTDSHILDLREQIEELVPHFQWYGLRSIDYSKPCSCKSESVGGIPGPVDCKRCMRSGYLFTDYLVKGYMWNDSMGVEFGTHVGKIATNRANFVCKHTRAISKFDYVIVLDIEHETGKLRQPFKIMKHYKVQDSVPLFGKDGRVEFFKATLEERNLDDGRTSEPGTNNPYLGNRGYEPF